MRALVQFSTPVDVIVNVETGVVEQVIVRNGDLIMDPNADVLDYDALIKDGKWDVIEGEEADEARELADDPGDWPAWDNDY